MRRLLLVLVPAASACTPEPVRAPEPAPSRIPPPLQEPEPAQAARPSQQVLADLEARHREFASALETAHGALLPRAQAADAALAARLTPQAPQARPHGYQVLPAIVADAAPQAMRLQERRYELQALGARFAGAVQDAQDLARGAATLPLEPAVARFEGLRSQLRNLEEHLSYHRYWQQAVVDNAVYFAGRNRIAAEVRAWQQCSDPAEAARLQRQVREQLAPFTAASGLHVENGRLVVPVWTDVQDAAFLAAFRQAVADVFPPAPELRIELELHPVPPASLYPEGAPAAGAEIDEADHLARFPHGALVLTTGGQSTHSYPGRSLQLGPDPIAPHILAHEFGHLLGFGDAYLRAFEGDPADPYGVVLVEWSGFSDDLMGNPASGAVTADMIQRLLEAYGR